MMRMALGARLKMDNAGRSSPDDDNADEVDRHMKDDVDDVRPLMKDGVGRLKMKDNVGHSSPDDNGAGEAVHHMKDLAFMLSYSWTAQDARPMMTTVLMKPFIM
ncbi:unnamed protein product [Cuscuta europaea]|uniref:Uncharacterized protein n=1 Tax=Cuscuta europaea TaxID=41803 RepID=A0A9P0ZAK2_CUSEU|nr:unnamed protein product [Cuscuta europaea]